MKATYKILPILYLVSVFTLTGCHDRKDTSGHGDGEPVKININWSEIAEMPEHIRLALYPTSGEAPIEYYIDPLGEQPTIPYGSYHVLVYNWRSNGDTQRVRFDGKDKYETMRAYTDFLQVRLSGDTVIQQPDELVTWSSGDNVLILSRPNGDEGVDVTLNISPKEMVSTFDFYIPATGLQYVRSAQAILTGVSRYVTLYNGEVSSPGYPMSVSIAPSTGKIDFHFTAFGFAPQEDYILKTKFWLIDGSVFEYTYDMKEDLEKKNKAINSLIAIPKAVGETSGFEEPEIDNWKEVSEDIPI